jgi:Tfp pilus assembly protein PilE
LITLGIVGVVAAMTIPNLVNKCQKIVWAKQAQKEYAMWIQVFKRILADNNTTSLSETELWSKLSSKESLYSTVYYSKDKDFLTELSKYVKISSRENDYTFILFNGASFNLWVHNKLRERDCERIKVFGGSMCTEIADIIIDINGYKSGPNTEGRDIFEFGISDEGILYPRGGKDYEIFDEYTDLASCGWYWKNYFTGEYSDYMDYERTGQLMEEGWKMNY